MRLPVLPPRSLPQARIDTISVSCFNLKTYFLFYLIFRFLCGLLGSDYLTRFLYIGKNTLVFSFFTKITMPELKLINIIQFEINYSLRIMNQLNILQNAFTNALVLSNPTV